MNQTVKTQTVGDLLIKQRKKAGLKLADISRQTFIKLEYLQAIEKNDFSSLPNASYAKAYISNYAKLLNLNPRPLLAILRRDYQESAKGRLLPREFLKDSFKKSNFFSPIRLTFSFIAVVFLSFSLYTAWQWYALSRPPRLEVFQPEDKQITAPQVLVEGQTVMDAVVLVNAQPVALQAGGFFSKELYFDIEGPTTITIKATDKRGKTNTVQRSIQVEF
jgi:cytoskeleton protein RodZ